ncbi:MAG: DUF86 domain-containing protein [bacterium]|nr:DUF86 domain-containing protein [bacterium]
MTKKLEQISELLKELERFLAGSFGEFEHNTAMVRAAERNFQLIVDIATDMNTQLLIDRGGPAPESYRQSFLELGKLGVLEQGLAKEISRSTGLRNILVHEYDINEDREQFYHEAKRYIPLFREYVRQLLGIKKP